MREKEEEEKVVYEVNKMMQKFTMLEFLILSRASLTPRDIWILISHQRNKNIRETRPSFNISWIW